MSMSNSMYGAANGLYTAIYISPHLDDAVLSCGGAIASRALRGEPVLVVTLCTGLPDRVSTYAQAHHHDSALGDHEAVTARLAEDEKAMQYLCIDRLWIGLQDAIYRQPDVYNADEALFGSMYYEEGAISTTVESLLRVLDHSPRATIYAPLGVGQHIDHQVAFAATTLLQDCFPSVFYYEDIPYVLQPGALQHRLAYLSRGSEPMKFVPRMVDIGLNIDRKLEAIRCYASQLGDVAAIRDYAFGIGGGGSPSERVWQRTMRGPMVC